MSKKLYRNLFLATALAVLVLADEDDIGDDDDEPVQSSSPSLSTSLGVSTSLSLSTSLGASTPLPISSSRQLSTISRTLGATITSAASSIIATATRSAELGPSTEGEEEEIETHDEGFYGFETAISAHGVMGILAFAIMFPLGGIIIRLLKNSLWKHAGWMLLAYALALATLGTGIFIAKEEGKMGDGHAIAGILVIAGLFLQPFTGYIHHRLFKRTGGRTAVSYAHMWVGIPLITIGIVNGLFGLRLADKRPLIQALYAVVALVIWILWMVTSVVAARRRSRAAAEQEQLRMQKLGDNSRPGTGSNIASSTLPSTAPSTMPPAHAYYPPAYQLQEEQPHYMSEQPHYMTEQPHYMSQQPEYISEQPDYVPEQPDYVPYIPPAVRAPGGYGPGLV